MVGASTDDVGAVEHVAGTSLLAHSVPPPPPLPPIAEQIRWDGKDVQTHALLALSIKRTIIPHICSCKTTKESWDTLATLYQTRNEARVAYL